MWLDFHSWGKRLVSQSAKWDGGASSAIRARSRSFPFSSLLPHGWSTCNRAGSAMRIKERKNTYKKEIIRLSLKHAMDPPWQVKKPLIATLDSIAMLSAGAFPSQPHWCRRPSPHECPPPGFLGNASFTLMSTLAHRKPLSIRQPAARQTHESRSVFSPVSFSFSLRSFVFLFFFGFFLFSFAWHFPLRRNEASRNTRSRRRRSHQVPLGDFETTNSLTNWKVHAGVNVSCYSDATKIRN